MNFQQKSSLCTATALAIGVTTVSGVPKEHREKPNVILIVADDLGWADLGFKSDYYETPNLDKLKSQSIYFPNAYASAANSAPSRACMITGKYAPRHGVYTVSPAARGRSVDRKLIPAENRKEILPGVETLPEVLQSAGYQTCHIGKWHVSSNPLEKGMDVNIGGNSSGHPKSYFSPYRNPNLKNGPKGEYLTDRLGDEAVNFITNADKDKPFFLYFATYSVHTPLQPKPELKAKYEKKKTTDAHFNPAYAALVHSLDENVGKVLAAVERLELDNTIIIFTSDNGGVYHISRQWPLRAGKGSFYEGGIRVPFMVYQKGVYDKGEIIEDAVSQIDIFPTILAFTDTKNDGSELDGENILPLLDQKADKKIAERALFWHFPAYLDGGNKETVDKKFRSRPVSVVRKGDWKLIENHENGKLELYNLKLDVSEKEDLAKKEVAKTKELYALLNAWKKEVKAPVPTELNPEYGGG